MIKTNTIRTTIRHLLGLARECREDRQHPTLYGSGFTLARKDTPNCIELRGEHTLGFMGSWNRRAVYMTRERAELALADLALRSPFPLEIVHRNTLRDRTEAQLLGLLETMIPHRNR